MFSLHSLAEMLYSQTLDEIPEQENDCIILDDVSQEKSPNRTEKKKRKTPSKKTVVTDDSDDCMIVSDGEQEVLTISDEETTPENCNKKRKTDDSNSDKTSDVIVIGKDKLPDDSDTVTSSEVSSAQKISQSVEMSTSDILTKQKSACQDVGSENPVSDGSVSQTDAQESEVSKEEGTSRKDSNLGLEKEVRIPEDNLESGSSASAAEKPVSDGNISQSKHDGGKSGSNENSQKGSNTKELEASEDQDKSPVTEENSISLASNKFDQITVEKETSSQLTTDPDQATSKSFEISTELKTSLNEYSSEKQDNAEANPVICSDSVLIESSDEDSNDCTIITKETLENIDDPSKATNKNIETDKVDNSKPMHTATQKQSSPTDKLSENYHQSVPDTVQDSDDNVIISDSVPANPEVIQKILDVELTEKSQEELTKKAVDKGDGQMLIKDVKIAEDVEEKETSQTDVKSVASENDSESVKSKQKIPVENSDSNETTNKKANDVEQLPKESRKAKDSDGKSNENLSEKEIYQTDVKSVDSEKNSESVKSKQVIPAENSDSNETINKKANDVELSKEKNLECSETKESDDKTKENLPELNLEPENLEAVPKILDIELTKEPQEELAECIPKILKSDSEMESENIQSISAVAKDDCQVSINTQIGVKSVDSENNSEIAKDKEIILAKTSDGKSEENLSELSTESNSNTITEINYSKHYNEVEESDKLCKELVPESIENVTHKQVISVENSDSNKKDVGESSKDEMTQCKETKNNDGEPEDNLSESIIESEITDKSDIVLEGNITDKNTDDDTVHLKVIMADSTEAENSDSKKTKSTKEVSTLEDRTDTDDTDILLKEKGVSNETHCVRNETPET